MPSNLEDDKSLSLLFLSYTFKLLLSPLLCLNITVPFHCQFHCTLHQLFKLLVHFIFLSAPSPLTTTIYLASNLLTCSLSSYFLHVFHICPSPNPVTFIYVLFFCPFIAFPFYCVVFTFTLLFLQLSVSHLL